MHSTRLQQRPAKGSLTKSDLSKTGFGKKTLRWMRNKRTLYYNKEILKIYQFICKTLYNDWAAAFAAYNPRRLIGVSVIPMYDIAWAIEELERTLQKGLLNPMINCQAPEGCPLYRDPVYDRFWAAASDAGAPVTLHLLT